MAETLLGLEVAFYLYPCGLFVTLLASQSYQFYRDRHGVTRQTATDDEQKKASRLYARIIWGFQLILSLLLLATIILAVHGAIAGQYDGAGKVVFPFSAYLASYVAVLLYYLAGLLPDPEGPWTPTSAHFYAWIVGTLFEAFIAAVFSSEKNSFRVHNGLLDTLDIVAAVRIVVLVAMMVCLILRDYKLKPLQPKSDPEERQSLLGNGNGNGNGASHNYGGAHPHGPAAHKPPARTQVSGTGWLDYFAGFRVLFPYLWPKDSPVYQGIVVVCIILLVGQRTINVLAPIQLGTLVDSLGYGTILTNKLFSMSSTVLSRATRVFSVPRDLFSGSRSLKFHLNKKIGEVTSALSRGSAMNTFLENFCFQVFPMVFDIFVAGVVFFAKYDAFYTIIVFFIMWSYIFLTIYVAKYRGKQRRDMATKNREMEATKTDAIMAYETVQHNCAVVPETERFKEHVVSVGDFVSLINYFVQLQGPLNFFGTYYTMLQNNLIEAERMLELFKETSGIVEKPDAVTLPAVKGEVAFNNVKFSYQSKKGEPAINGVSFTVAPGTKTAIVGESGSGKSTCLKLLFRFYDINEGSITVDGHDLKDLKLDSLRKNIGVVPQDTVLFNATIMYNLLYADRNASQADVYEACKAANIHDRILAFPDGYDTKVGERGLKLSGGERQRIAIARAILKDARILLLDEATASLDSHTERQIQDALERVTAGRTTITIAHRLSTITTSDQIVVLHKGNVVERGTHAELLALGGRYHAMWEKQTTTEKKNIEKVEKEGESSETASQQ
ncbi:uncharacterized protein N0V96_008312 [Colletotrichum fioriniae]|uniref:uncharacterized protein n=1 Tax=Colletotrichum fioriniae TaxID=710243 RepID=UPI0032DBCA2A|nr:hypothetical protein N0V96_008312 [Colletotrichum fioriniae]